SDASVSIRDGRAVIPVSAANKRRVPGFIHDQSATGKTFYIEPVEIVEINNELKELAYAERREVVRVLTEFTDSIRENSDEIEAAADYLSRMDMIRAKARWALDNDATVPIISEEGRLTLRKARHPLLRQALAKERKEVVPLDLTLDPANRILVISGPNAGGKSVCLKTVGLLQYMFQSGLPVTALDNSEMPIFDSLFIDIGDEQSIDNDLSTYSSHLHNMRAMLSGATNRSLVLIDEFGSGTEPVIGGAISEAILEKFVEQGTYGVITTHYTNIKYFASNHEGVFNGAMMFDVQNIAPLFRLETGTPGSSFAVEIARKTGLPEQIIASAGAKAGSDYMNLERQLREVARDRRYWEQKRDRIRVTDRRVEELENSYAESLAKLKEERRTIIKEAKDEAARIIAEANRQIENTIRTIKESQAEKEATRRARSEFDSFRNEVSQQESKEDSERQAAIEREMARVAERQRKRAERKMQQGEKVKAEQSAEPEKAEVAVGRKVRISGQEIIGEVKEMQGKKALVAFGQILTTVAINRLEVVSTAEYKKQNRPTSARTVVSVDISSRKLNFKDNIDVRGMRAAEALERVTEFIDDAIMVGVGTVTILHGKGTGALKEEIRRYLRSISEVASATDDHPDRGGAGITVVTFK
ncbi:MAG: Smr/MutS family protein, partial [Tidjanibacter sp.]|nr:Smr/MutS family protein [Tidjanibacter sp.]